MQGGGGQDEWAAKAHGNPRLGASARASAQRDAEAAQAAQGGPPRKPTLNAYVPPNQRAKGGAGAAAASPGHVHAGPAAEAPAAAALAEGPFSTEPPALLYMDLLNFATPHFFDRESADWSLERPRARVAAFCAAVANSGLSIVCFADYDTATPEADRKWRTRREEEVRAGVRTVPQAMATLIGEMFRAEGVEVRLSQLADNDDTLAAHAQADGADVLSGDKDFFRYRGRRFRIYDAFEIAGEGLRLRQRLSAPERFAPVPRDLLSPPPATYGAADGALLPRTLWAKRIFQGGAPSPLVRALGSPHAATRPLRRALYARVFGPAGSAGSLRPADAPPEPLAQVRVKEVWPCFNAASGMVVWTKDEVAPFDEATEAEPAAAVAAPERAVAAAPEAAAAAAPAPAPEAAAAPASTSEAVAAAAAPAPAPEVKRTGGYVPPHRRGAGGAAALPVAALAPVTAQSQTPVQPTHRYFTAAVAAPEPVRRSAREWNALLLGPPEAAFSACFPAEASGRGPPVKEISPQKWSNHCTACRTITLELCAAARGATLLSLLTAAS